MSRQAKLVRLEWLGLVVMALLAFVATPVWGSERNRTANDANEQSLMDRLGLTADDFVDGLETPSLHEKLQSRNRVRDQREPLVLTEDDLIDRRTADNCPGEFNEETRECFYDDNDVPERSSAESLSASMQAESLLLTSCTCNWSGSDYVCSGAGNVYWTYPFSCPPSNVGGSVKILNGCVVYDRGCDFTAGGDLHIEGTGSQFISQTSSSYRPDINLGDDLYIISGGKASLSETNLNVNDRIQCESTLSDTLAITNTSDVYVANRIWMKNEGGLTIDGADITFGNPTYTSARTTMDGGPLNVMNSTFSCSTSCPQSWAFYSRYDGDISMFSSTVEGFRDLLYHEGDGDIQIGASSGMAIPQNYFNDFWGRGIWINLNEDFDQIRILNNIFNCSLDNSLNPSISVPYAVRISSVSDLDDTGEYVQIQDNDILLNGNNISWNSPIKLEANRADSLVKWNIVSGFTGYGIYYESDALREATVIGNIVYSNLDEQYGIYIFNSNDTSLEQNWVWGVDNDNPCVYTQYSNNVSWVGNLEDSGVIDLYECSYGIKVEQSDHFLAQSTEIANTDANLLGAINVELSADTVIGGMNDGDVYITGKENNAGSNYAITLDNDGFGTDSGCIVQKVHATNIWSGMDIYNQTEGCEIHDNVIEFTPVQGSVDNRTGILLQYAPESTISNNTMSRDLEQNIKYIGLDGNYTCKGWNIYHNTFMGPDFGVKLTGDLTDGNMNCLAEYNTFSNDFPNTIGIGIAFFVQPESGVIIRKNIIDYMVLGINILHGQSIGLSSSSSITCNNMKVEWGINYLNTTNNPPPGVVNVGGEQLANKIEIYTGIHEDPFHLMFVGDNTTWNIGRNWTSLLGANDGRYPYTTSFTGTISVPNPYLNQWDPDNQFLCGW